MAGSLLSHHPRSSVKVQPGGRSSALKIVICYILCGCLWVLFSDQLLAGALFRQDVLTRWQTLKGWTFIALTAPLLYALMRRSIAALQHSHAALVEREAMYRRVVESDMIGIIFRGADGQVLDANDASLKMIGYTREDLLEGKVDWP